MVMLKKARGIDLSYNSSSIREKLSAYDWDVGALMPWVGKDGRTRITLTNEDGKPYNRIIRNANTAYTKDAWLRLEEQIVRMTRSKLRVVDDLTAEGLTHQVPEGMGVTMLQEELLADYGEARFTMDGMAKARRDRPEVSIRNFPLPLLTADMSFSGRQLAISRNGRNRLPIDLTTLEQLTRKMDEKVENMFVGTETYTFAGVTIYGLTTHPQRITNTLTLPTAPGWAPSVTVDEVLDMIQDLQDIYFSGPYGMYFSRAWGKYLNGDYSDSYRGGTLLNRLKEIDGIKWMRQLDALGTGFKIVLFSLDMQTIRVVNIVPYRVLNWNAMGGLAEHWKLLKGQVPQLRTNANNQIGLNVGIAA